MNNIYIQNMVPPRGNKLALYSDLIIHMEKHFFNCSVHEKSSTMRLAKDKSSYTKSGQLVAEQVSNDNRETDDRQEERTKDRKKRRDGT